MLVGRTREEDFNRIALPQKVMNGNEIKCRITYMKVHMKVNLFHIATLGFHILFLSHSNSDIDIS